MEQGSRLAVAGCRPPPRSRVPSSRTTQPPAGASIRRLDPSLLGPAEMGASPRAGRWRPRAPARVAVPASLRRVEATECRRQAAVDAPPLLLLFSRRRWGGRERERESAAGHGD
nr:unnamed protein product [Digitaria exilis]